MPSSRAVFQAATAVARCSRCLRGPGLPSPSASQGGARFSSAPPSRPSLFQARAPSPITAALVLTTSLVLGAAYLSSPALRMDAAADSALSTPHDHRPGTKQPSGQKLIAYSEVQKHNTRDDCWVIVDGMVYDVTRFLPDHPGGPGIIVAHAGGDATKIFKPIHPPDALQQLEEDQVVGPVDPTTVPAPEETGPTEEEERMEREREKMPGAEGMLLVQDFEDWAEKVLSGTAWNYYRSAADYEITFDNNRHAFEKYYFRPRILNDVTTGDVSTTFMGMKTSLPVFISPAAMAKLGHPAGEVNLTKGAGRMGIVQGISINASCSLDEIMAARQEGQDVMFQIYLNKDRKASEALLKKVTDLGASAVIFTVDTAWKSKRTRDVRAKASIEAPIKDSASEGGRGGSKAPLGISAAISGYQDTNLTWGDIDFIRANTHLPIIVKGVQCVEDVDLLAQKGVKGVILSNHGGRQCDYAPAGIDLLYEIRANRPDLFEKVDIMMDGGVRSGADVVKALALGAKAVGLGRPFLYANGTHGQEGVERVCEILAEEINNTMRNCGARTIAELKPELVGFAGPWIKGNRPPWMGKA